MWNIVFTYVCEGWGWAYVMLNTIQKITSIYHIIVVIWLNRLCLVSSDKLKTNRTNSESTRSILYNKLSLQLIVLEWALESWNSQSLMCSTTAPLVSYLNVDIWGMSKYKHIHYCFGGLVLGCIEADFATNKSFLLELNHRFDT